MEIVDYFGKCVSSLGPQRHHLDEHWAARRGPGRLRWPTAAQGACYLCGVFSWLYRMTVKGNTYFPGYLPFFVHWCYFCLGLFKRVHMESYTYVTGRRLRDALGWIGLFTGPETQKDSVTQRGHGDGVELTPRAPESQSCAPTPDHHPPCRCAKQGCSLLRKLRADRTSELCECRPSRQVLYH